MTTPKKAPSPSSLPTPEELTHAKQLLLEELDGAGSQLYRVEGKLALLLKVNALRIECEDWRSDDDRTYVFGELELLHELKKAHQELRSRVEQAYHALTSEPWTASGVPAKSEGRCQT